MPEVTRQRTGKLLRELFEILLVHPEGLQARDALRELAARVPPTEHKKGIYKTGGRRYDFIVRFATVDCVKAGWMVKSRGRWLTGEGKRAWETFKEPDDLGLTPGKDGGIDILAWGDPLGTRPPRLKVQVKRRTDSVNVEASAPSWPCCTTTTSESSSRPEASPRTPKSSPAPRSAGSCRFSRFTSWLRRIEGARDQRADILESRHLPAGTSRRGRLLARGARRREKRPGTDGRPRRAHGGRGG